MLQTQFGVPGQTAAVFTAANEFLWGGDVSKIQVLSQSVTIDGAARDAANSPTTILRPGLIMGKVAATNKYKQWDPDGADGTQYAVGVLPVELIAVDPLTGSDADKVCPLIVKAPVRAKALLAEGAVLVGDTDEFLARRQLGQAGFTFDDDPAGYNHGAQRVVTKATDYVVLASDNGTLFVAITADATFTLPALKPGLEFEFLRASDHEMVVASAEGDNMVVGNDLSADSITFTTAGEQIGARVKVKAIYLNGTLKWIPELPYTPFGVGAATLAFGLAT